MTEAQLPNGFAWSLVSECLSEKVVSEKIVVPFCLKCSPFPFPTVIHKMGGWSHLMPCFGVIAHFAERGAKIGTALPSSSLFSDSVATLSIASEVSLHISRVPLPPPLLSTKAFKKSKAVGLISTWFTESTRPPSLPLTCLRKKLGSYYNTVVVDISIMEFYSAPKDLQWNSCAWLLWAVAVDLVDPKLVYDLPSCSVIDASHWFFSLSFCVWLWAISICVTAVKRRRRGRKEKKKRKLFSRFLSRDEVLVPFQQTPTFPLALFVFLKITSFSQLSALASCCIAAALAAAAWTFKSNEKKWKYSMQQTSTACLACLWSFFKGQWSWQIQGITVRPSARPSFLPLAKFPIIV